MIEFTFEKSETLTVRRTRKIVAAWCMTCGCDSRMSAPEDAAPLTGISTRDIYSRIESGNTHFTELSDGVLLGCLASLDPIRDREIAEE